MARVNRFVLFAAVAAIALAAGYFARTAMDLGEPGQDPAKVLLAATLNDLAGQPQPLAQWRGKVMVVNFWATWCPPCLKEIPEFVGLQQRYGSKGVQFIGIAIDDKMKVAAFVAQHGVNYPILMAEEQGITLARDAGNRLGGLPFTVIIDRQGRTARVELGILVEQKLVAILESLL